MGQTLRNKLTAIHTELCIYSETVFTDMNKAKYFIVSVKYGVIMQAIHDLHQGSIKQQKSALSYFKGPQYEKDCIDVGIDIDVMNQIVFSPNQYADRIGYVEPTTDDEEDHFFPFEGE